MACGYPKTMFRIEGKWTFKAPLNPSLFARQEISCGQCASCRLAKASDWATRLVLEGRSVSAAFCMTLTYAPENLPDLGSLHYPHVLRMFKRLRDRGFKFSYDVVGEYSPERLRPHYHVAVFGWEPPDQVYAGKSQAGNIEYSSEILTKCWGLGRVTYQLWSSGAAQYLAGHHAWKLSDAMTESVRQVFDQDGKFLGTRTAQFHHCSTRPGIGRRHFEKYGLQDLRQNSVIDGKYREVPLPKYFVRLAKEKYPELHAAVVEERRQALLDKAQRDGPSAASREYVHLRRIEDTVRRSGSTL